MLFLLKKLHEKAMHNVSNFISASVSILIRLLVTLVLIKYISSFGEPGALATWGTVQNLVGIAAALTGLSVQTGISSSVAVSKNNLALLQGLLIVCLTTLCFLIISFSLQFLNIDMKLPLHYVILIGTFAAIYNYFMSYLPVKGKINLLTIMYIIFGVTVLSSLFYFGLNKFNSFLKSLLLGYFAATLFVAIYERKEIFKYYSINSIFNLKDYKLLLGFGAASLVNAVSTSMMLLFIRSDLAANSGVAQADLFEAGNRIVALLEVSLSSVVSLLMWQNLGNNTQRGFKFYAGYILLMVTGLLIFYIFINVFNNLFISILFSDNFLGIKEAYSEIFFYALFKLVSAVALMPLFLNGRIKLLIFSELLCLLTVFICYNLLGSLLVIEDLALAFTSLAAGFSVFFIFIMSCNFIFLIEEYVYFRNFVLVS